MNGVLMYYKFNQKSLSSAEPFSDISRINLQYIFGWNICIQIHNFSESYCISKSQITVEIN